MEYIKNRNKYRKIHIGLIASCNKTSQYGIIYGFREHPLDKNKTVLENKLFYFKKSPKLKIEKNTLVSYLSYDFNEFSPIVDYVYPISSLTFHHDRHEELRDDDIYHDDTAWQLINEGIPYFDYLQGRSYCIYYPIIDGDKCTIWEGSFGSGIYMRKEAVIYELYEELTSLKYTSWPSFEEVINAIDKFREHIDSINAFEIINSFIIKERGLYISRPGKDDHYFIDRLQCLPDDEKYLSYLLPTKEENVFYDHDAYPSDGYFEGEKLLEDETKKAIKKAKKEYSKEKHFAFLISDFFENAMKDINRANEIKNKLEEEFDVRKAQRITSQFNGKITEELIELISQYNNSTTVNPQ